jgi:hypothetical protein
MEEFELPMKWSFLKPLLLQMVIVPEHMRPRD